MKMMRKLLILLITTAPILMHAWQLPGSPIKRKGALNRRNVLSKAVIGASSALLLAPPAFAAKEPPKGLVAPEEVVDLLRAVPTFSIVDPNGVPFMVVGEDAKVTCYFFTTYAEASRILALAKSSADKAIRSAKLLPGENVEPNPWLSARVSSVPLDFAVTLASKSIQSAYFRVAPAESDVEDALQVTGKKSLLEGKVPIFYFEDYTIEDKNGQSRTPLFFRKSELLASYNKSSGSREPVPDIKVTELFSVLTQMTNPGGTDEGLKTLFFVPPLESVKKAKDCNAKAKGAPFQLGQQVIVL